ncbi:MAG: nucleotidyltransferase domain-containing protein [Proteobacteria bacterium]|nr:nucleotidyltransferase domain-containing protein [Pseudomonadota bacterium]
MSDQEEITNNIRTVLTDFPEVRYAAVFGSLVKNRLAAVSDIDIAIAGEKPFSFEFILELTRSLNDELSHCVDLIDLQSVSGAILQQALCTGVTVKKTSTILLASLIKKMWYNQADMMPNVLMSQKKHCARFLNG